MLSSSRSSSIHFIFMGVGIMQEIVAYIRYKWSDKKQVFYYSNIFDQLEIFFEIYWKEALNDEDVKPIILATEVLKFFCKANQYFSLIRQEKVGDYMTKEEYTKLQEDKSQEKQEHKYKGKWENDHKDD